MRQPMPSKPHCGHSSAAAAPAECLAIAASLGGDADITAAIVGELAGAHYGAAAFPESWRAAVARGDEIEDLADALYEAGRRK